MRGFRSFRVQTFVLIVALWCALGTLTLWDAKTEMRTAALGANTLADALAAHTVGVMHEAEQVAALVAYRVQDQGVSLPLAYYVSAGLFKLDMFVQVAVIDSQGYLRASTTPGFTPVNLSDREHFRIHLKNPSTALMVGKPVRGRASGVTSLQLSQRINGLDGRFLGVVVVSLDPKCLTKTYDGWKRGKQGFLTVVGTHDFIVRALRSGGGRPVGAMLPPGDALRRALAHAGTGALRMESATGGGTLTVSYRTLEQYPLAVAVGYAANDYLAPWRMRSVLLLGAALLMTTLIVLAERRSKRLLASLAESTQREVAKSGLLEQARADAEAASRAKSAFLATMSHEIRTPMNGVLGMSDVLARSPLLPDQQEMVDTIRDSAGALLRIIDDILDFSKIEAGKLEIDCAPVSIEAIVQGVAASLAPVADARGVRLHAQVAPEMPPWISADDTRLRQVLYNLLGNAVKFSSGRPGTEGHVQLRALTAGTHAAPTVRFEIADNGIGMTPDTLAKLFRPFIQAEASTTRRFGGTGLGLAICRRLVALMNGELSVTSEPGRGSTFVVQLPLILAIDPREPSPGCPAAAAPSREDSPPLDGTVTILVAEDDAVNRKVIQRQLEMLGYAADIACDGEAALAMWRAAGRYTLLLTDLHMPKRDGYALAQAIRAAEAEQARARMPIVALTANAIRGEAMRAKAFGIDEYLTKPLQLSELERALAHWCANAGRTQTQPDGMPPPVAPEPPILDLDVLRAILGEDPDAVQSLLSEYLVCAAPLAAQLTAALRRGDGQSAQALAHKLKSSSRAVGALLLGALCERIESLAGEQHAPYDALAAEFDIAYGAAIDRVRGAARQPSTTAS